MDILPNGSEPMEVSLILSELKHLRPEFCGKERKKKILRFYPIKEMIDWSRHGHCPGTKGLEHRIGGIEKNGNTGNIFIQSRKSRSALVKKSSKLKSGSNSWNFYTLQKIDSGEESGEF